MNHAHRYATRIAEKYGVELTPGILDKIAACKTIGEVAIEVLPQPELDKWQEATFEETNRLRSEFGMPLFTRKEQPQLVSNRK